MRLAARRGRCQSRIGRCGGRKRRGPERLEPRLAVAMRGASRGGAAGALLGLLLGLLLALSVRGGGASKASAGLVTCGSVLKLLNTQHKVRLHSHDIKYGSGARGW